MHWALCSSVRREWLRNITHLNIIAYTNTKCYWACNYSLHLGHNICNLVKSPCSAACCTFSAAFVIRNSCRCRHNLTTLFGSAGATQNGTVYIHSNSVWSRDNLFCLPTNDPHANWHSMLTILSCICVHTPLLHAITVPHPSDTV